MLGAGLSVKGQGGVRNEGGVRGREWGWGWRWGGGGFSFVACLSHLTIDHASLSRRSTVLTPNKDTSNIGALITLLPYIT